MLLKKAIAYAIALYLAALLLIILLLSHSTQPTSRVSIVPAAVPPDFAAIENTIARKAAFFDFFKPLIAAENQKLQTKRERLLAIQATLRNGDTPPKKETQWVDNLAKAFAVPQEAGQSFQGVVNALVQRVDTLPASLVLVQAANESAWGRSRFATQGNNYFGQWCFKKGCGLVPNQRSTNAAHEVRKFKSAAESVAAYFHNINTHRAYNELRKMREYLRVQHREPTGTLLAAGLQHYSERGDDYIEELRMMIRVNGLEKAQP